MHVLRFLKQYFLVLAVWSRLGAAAREHTMLVPCTTIVQPVIPCLQASSLSGRSSAVLPSELQKRHVQGRGWISNSKHSCPCRAQRCPCTPRPSSSLGCCHLQTQLCAPYLGCFCRRICHPPNAALAGMHGDSFPQKTSLLNNWAPKFFCRFCRC